MGCRGSKSTIKAVNVDAQVNKLASNTLPPEVMAGLDKILRTSAGAGTILTTRKSPNRQLERQTTEETQRGYSQNPSLANTKVEVSVMEQTNKDEFFPVKLSGFKEDFGLETGKGLTELGLDSYRRGMDEVMKGEEPMPGMLYDEPVTNPYFELLKTKAEGRVPLEEMGAGLPDSDSPISRPKLAFTGDFTGLTTDKISVA